MKMSPYSHVIASLPPVIASLPSVIASLRSNLHVLFLDCFDPRNDEDLLYMLARIYNPCVIAHRLQIGTSGIDN